ncbi:MAG: glutamate racemase, partial [Alistipes sp.]|nr:glutamate racemase [Alistipes sp.]
TPMLEAGADQIVLGCTHYPFLTPVMHRIIGDRQVTLGNPAAAIERQVDYLLERENLRAEATHSPQYDFMTSADEAYRQRLIAKSLLVRAHNFGV